MYAHRQNWFPPTPSSENECVTPLAPKGGGGSNNLLQVGGGGSNSDNWIEGLALSKLSGLGGRVEMKKPFTKGAA